jgi:hypothetical protein
MTDDLERIERKLDEVINALPMIYALGSILVRRSTATERLGLNKNTLDQNKKVEKFEVPGKRGTYMELKDITVIKQRKRK